MATHCRGNRLYILSPGKLPNSQQTTVAATTPGEGEDQNRELLYYLKQRSENYSPQPNYGPLPVFFT